MTGRSIALLAMTGWSIALLAMAGSSIALLAMTGGSRGCYFSLNELKNARYSAFMESNVSAMPPAVMV